MEDSHWYKDAVIYEVHVRAFQDSNGDGIGDFPGLTSRLDYIQDLGVNTIWLLPFYPSPGRDDGYDISDYHDIHPQYGTREDFQHFIDEAHRRGLRVITELVINHTSDQHPWFQAARHAEKGSPKRDYYVWSDDPEKYAGTRIIFTDTEPSNWTWDPVAKQYYWHRFFSHQPDLNFDNPHVEAAVLKTMRFWLDQGVDGLRLDAIPYLIEREGTSNENLRETHEVIKRIRKVIDEHYADRMLLGEANMWPEDVREYFADGDECHMAYHFPLMPRMYMAIALEDRYPIVEIMEQTPDIPPGCQWAIFLRNHDELTLEMVTDRERDYMYRMYASDARARLNVGIRRRLAPLMENDIERIKLMNGLLMSMPGSPIIYYGDEIGMGDNLYLGDRNGVRTPMQWSPDRNAGFSRADPQSLYLPPIMDAIYGYEAVNVEAQSRDRSSLLNWMKRLLQIRTSTRAFGRGTLRFVRPGNRKVLCYVREHEDEQLLCVVNLSRSAQPVELSLSEFKGHVPVEMMGRTPFPPIGELPYLLTLPAYGFYWFRLSREAEPPAWHEERLAPEDTPVLVLTAGWDTFFPDSGSQWRGTHAGKLRTQLEEQLLPAFLANQRWFGDKGAKTGPVRLRDHAQWRAEHSHWLLALFDVDAQGTRQPYFMPLALVDERVDEARWARLQGATIARVRQQAVVGVLADAIADERFCLAVVDAIGAGTELPTREGRIRFVPTTSFRALRGEPGEALDTTVIPQGTNSATRVGEHLFLKAYRRLQEGIALELEVGRYLTEEAQFPNIVPVAGSVEYASSDGRHFTLGLLQAFVRNQGDGWEYTVGYLERFLGDQPENSASRDGHGEYLQRIRILGRRTAELHRALGASTSDRNFSAEPVTAADLDAWRKRAMHEAEGTLAMMEEALPRMPESVQTGVSEVLKGRATLMARIAALATAVPRASKMRQHGDYHLGQVLLSRDDFLIIDFEGEPARSPQERREKVTPMRDVAGMLRSFAYARRAARQHCSDLKREDCSAWDPYLAEWEREARAAFLAGYDEVAAGLLYDSLQEQDELRQLFEIEKALYEMRYELRNRPEWAEIPLATLRELSH